MATQFYLYVPSSFRSSFPSVPTFQGEPQTLYNMLQLNYDVMDLVGSVHFQHIIGFSELDPAIE